MTPRSLFIIILRVAGLFLFIDILRVLPQMFSNLSFLLRSDDISTAMIGSIFSLLILLIYFYVVRYTLFRADKLVDKLGLDKNFTEEKFEFNMHRSSIIKIAIIVIGGMTLVEFFVPLILSLFIWVQNKNEQDMSSVNKMAIVRDLIMVLIGYFLISNSRMLTTWIEKKKKD